MTLEQFRRSLPQVNTSPLLPALFVGHGSPMNALLHNVYTESWAQLGKTLPKPRAILAISAHWVTRGVHIDNSPRPKTIHDFVGFPPELYRQRYDCPGSPAIATEAQKHIGTSHVTLDTDWGIDHGTWVVLRHMYPEATIPVFQMSLDEGLSCREHYALGKTLRDLRAKGVLIMGSGNIVHNLGRIVWGENAKPLSFATSFDELAAQYIADGNHAALINYAELGEDAMLAIPTPEHFWPLLYILALQGENEPVTFPTTGIALGSLSMRSVQIG